MRFYLILIQNKLWLDGFLMSYEEPNKLWQCHKINLITKKLSVKSPGQTAGNQQPKKPTTGNEQPTSRQPHEQPAQIYKLAHTKLEHGQKENHNGRSSTSS